MSTKNNGFRHHYVALYKGTQLSFFAAVAKLGS